MVPFVLYKFFKEPVQVFALSLFSRRGELGMFVVVLGAMTLQAVAQNNNVPLFDPPETPERYQATRINETLSINGKLDESAWQTAEKYSSFVQKEPYQQEPPSSKTEVRILFDEKYLYIGAICYDDLSQRKNLRVQTMQRDFNYFENDLFGIAIDGFLDKRNALAFQTTPYGAQRELQVFDDEAFNREWDALWKVRTNITDSAWTAEFAIPWKTIRYPANATSLGVIFTRNIRRYNEYDVMPAVPRRFFYRMSYEGLITNLQPPPPSPNIQVNPYLFYSNDQIREGNAPPQRSGEPKVGGEVKWAMNPNSVLDATFNTDFAQADVDRQVVNLSRFSVLFPERRQFFLEGANIFNASVNSFIQPFFSRKIGLDENGNSIPIDAGLRFTNQSSSSSAGALLMRQRSTASSPLTYFGIGRYSQNVGQQNKIGGMLTYKGLFPSEGDTTFSQVNNYTATANMFFRPSQSTTISAMVSGSSDDVKGDGIASQVWVAYQNNLMYIGLFEYFVKNYQPGAGLELFGRDYLFTGPGIDFDLRPKWLPKMIRALGPDLEANIFHDPTQIARALSLNLPGGGRMRKTTWLTED
ncbi:MAG: DUF5916 domain-containing protein, partial [Bacteroidota bacterium]